MSKKLTFDQPAIQNWLTAGRTVLLQGKVDRWLTRVRRTGEGLATGLAGTVRQAESKFQQVVGEQPTATIRQKRGTENRWMKAGKDSTYPSKADKALRFGHQVPMFIPCSSHVQATFGCYHLPYVGNMTSSLGN